MESFVQNPSILQQPITIGHALSGAYAGRILIDSNIVAICNKECVQIINLNDGDVIQEWKCSYGEIYYMTAAICGVHQFIILAACSEATSSIIIILEVPSLAVLNLLFFPSEITCLSLLTCDTDFCVSDCLRCSDGILAVGSHGGKVHLLDLDISRSLAGPVHNPTPVKFQTNSGGHPPLVLFQGIS